MATSVTEKLSEETFEYQCSRCSKTNRVAKSEKFCLECQQHLCSGCLELHNSFLDNHSLQDPAHSSQCQQPTERCTKHPAKILEMYCKDHDDLGCSTCAFTDHRSCVSVVDIPSTIQQLFDPNILGQVKTDLKKLSSKFTDAKSIGKEHAKKISREKKKHISAIDDYVETLVVMIQKLGDEARQSLLKAYKTEEDKLHNNQKACESAESETQLLLKEIENQDRNKAQLFVSMKKGQKITNRANTLLQKQDEQRQDILPHFDKNCEIEKYLTKLQSLGRVTCQPLETIIKQPELYRWKKIQKKSIKIKSDSHDCIIFGSCLLPDGSLLLSDMNNQKLKHLDPTTLTITAHCDLPAGPRGVCCISQQEAAVCLSNKTIQFVSPCDMTLKRSIEVNHSCYGIDYHNNKLCVSNSGNGVVFYNMEGSLLQTVDLGLSSTYSVVSSKSGDKIYIADWNKGLVCVDSSMKEQFRYKGHGLSVCTGVCMDHPGSVFVCGRDSHNVVQVTEAGQPLGEVASGSDGVEAPWSLSWDSGRGKLYVAAISDTILIFEA